MTFWDKKWDMLVMPIRSPYRTYIPHIRTWPVSLLDLPVYQIFQLKIPQNFIQSLSISAPLHNSERIHKIHSNWRSLSYNFAVKHAIKIIIVLIYDRKRFEITTINIQPDRIRLCLIYDEEFHEFLPLTSYFAFCLHYKIGKKCMIFIWKTII